MPTKIDVWRYNSKYSGDVLFKKWQDIMRRASRYGRMYQGELYPIGMQRRFRCSLCRHHFARYAYYPQLLFLCEQHADGLLEARGIQKDNNHY